MIAVPAGVRVWLATGHTDIREGFDGLAMLVQETLKRDPHDGQLFVFRGKRGQHTTFYIQFSMRDDCVSLAAAVGANTAGVAVPPRQGSEVHLH